MRLSVTLLSSVMLVGVVSAQTRSPAAQQPASQSLALRRVVLYSNGVAYFERRGSVSGDAEISLPLKQSQVDDVLKSLVVLDLSGGRVGAVSYNSSAPPSARLAEIPFSVQPHTNGDGDDQTYEGLGGILEQLQGAKVTVAAAGRLVTGSVLTVEERETRADEKAAPVLTRWLVVATEAGELVSLDLAEVRGVRVLDEGARHDIAEFADASAAARRRDAKTIVISASGSGTREMVVSYLVAAPIWKTTLPGRAGRIRQAVLSGVGHSRQRGR